VKWCWNGPCLGRTSKFKTNCVLTFKQTVPRLAEQDDIISYVGALKMDLAEGAGMVCAGSATSQHPQNLEK